MATIQQELKPQPRETPEDDIDEMYEEEPRRRAWGAIASVVLALALVFVGYQWNQAATRAETLGAQVNGLRAEAETQRLRAEDAQRQVDTIQKRLVAMSADKDALAERLGALEKAGSPGGEGRTSRARRRPRRRRRPGRAPPRWRPAGCIQARSVAAGPSADERAVERGEEPRVLVPGAHADAQVLRIPHGRPVPHQHALGAKRRHDRAGRPPHAHEEEVGLGRGMRESPGGERRRQRPPLGPHDPARRFAMSQIAGGRRRARLRHPADVEGLAHPLELSDHAGAARSRSPPAARPAR